MPTLSPGQIASMRLTFAGALAGGHATSVEVLRNEGQRNGRGGRVDSWVSIATYDAEVEAKTPYNESLRGGRLEASEKYLFAFPWYADVRASDRLLCEGITFEVVDADAISSNQVTINVTARKVG